MPESSEPTLPPDAQQSTAAGAGAFIRYYFAVYAHAFWTGDSTVLQSVSDTGCTFCTGAISAVRNIRARGERVTGGRITVVASAVAPMGTSDRTVLALRLDQDGAQTLSTSGAVVSTSQGERGRLLDVAVRWAADHWVLVGATTVEATPS